MTTSKRLGKGTSTNKGSSTAPSKTKTSKTELTEADLKRVSGGLAPKRNPQVLPI